MPLARMAAASAVAFMLPKPTTDSIDMSPMAQAGALAAQTGAPLAGDHQNQPGDATASEADAPTAWLLCGPESGLAETEVEQALTQGWQPALLGPRVLRTEPAGLVGLTVLQAALGDLG